MSRADDAADLAALLSKVTLHARLGCIALKRVPDGRRDDAWLDALDEVREVLDLATGLRVRFEKWSKEANGMEVPT